MMMICNRLLRRSFRLSTSLTRNLSGTGLAQKKLAEDYESLRGNRLLVHSRVVSKFRFADTTDTSETLMRGVRSKTHPAVVTCNFALIAQLVGGSWPMRGVRSKTHPAVVTCNFALIAQLVLLHFDEYFLDPNFPPNLTSFHIIMKTIPLLPESGSMLYQWYISRMVELGYIQEALGYFAEMIVFEPWIQRPPGLSAYNYQAPKLKNIQDLDCFNRWIQAQVTVLGLKLIGKAGAQVHLVSLFLFKFVQFNDMRGFKQLEKILTDHHLSFQFYQNLLIYEKDTSE